LRKSKNIDYLDRLDIDKYAKNVYLGNIAKRVSLSDDIISKR